MQKPTNLNNNVYKRLLNLSLSPQQTIKSRVAGVIVDFVDEHKNNLENEEAVHLWYVMWYKGDISFKSFPFLKNEGSIRDFFSQHYDEINRLVNQYNEIETKPFSLNTEDIIKQLVQYSISVQVYNIEYSIHINNKKLKNL